MFADENMNDIGETAASPSSSKFVIKTKEDQEETITIGDKTYNKKEELRKLEMLINRVSNKVNVLKEIMDNSENDSSLSNVMEELAGFPIQAYSQVAHFDKKLKEDPNYRMKVLNRLRRETAKYGSINKKIKEALNILLDRSLARSMNWSGRSARRVNPKYGFQQFHNIFKILLSIDDDLLSERSVIYAIQVYFNSI